MPTCFYKSTCLPGLTDTSEPSIFLLQKNRISAEMAIRTLKVCTINISLSQFVGEPQNKLQHIFFCGYYLHRPYSKHTRGRTQLKF